MKNKHYSIFLTLVIAGSSLLARLEIVSTLGAQGNWEKLSSPQGIMAVSLYVLLSLVGVSSLIIRFWSTSTLWRFPLKSDSVWFRWLAIAGLLVIVAWVYLFSPWQFILTGRWTQLLFAAGFANLTSLALSRRRAAFTIEPGEIALIACMFLFPRLVNEFRLLTESSLVSRIAALLGYASILAVSFALYHPAFEPIRVRSLSLRDRIGHFRWIIILPFWFAPIIYRYAVGVEINDQYGNLRFAVLFLSLWVTTFLTNEQKDRIVSFDFLGINFGILILTSAVAGKLSGVVNYPFGLYWSEGNRFYDYSLLFGQSLYNHPGTIINPYGVPGRYGLWGVMFLFDGLPIWAHRLWNLVLQVVPPMLFSLLVARKIQPAGLRYQTALWMSLFFIVLVPLHPPFMIASIIVAWLAFDKSPVKRGLSLLVAGYYVAISRWTWAFAPGAMGALIDLLLYYPRRTGNWFKRLLPTIILTILGILPGLWQNFGTFQSTIQGETNTAQQPLLWYRLLPNDTLGPGVLFLTLLYTAPLWILLAWWMGSKQWRLDIWQKLAVWGALAGFFAVGMVISTKIGGGGDLHNLDMYLITLMLVLALALTDLTNNSERLPLPPWAAGLIVLLIVLPIHQFTPLDPSYAGGQPNLADPEKVQAVLSAIRTEVDSAAQNGEVLFMDQRQLLTFGYVSAIPFVPEYEKKYMMDRAMANNADYFKSYYRDLANRRFTLIVTEILRSNLKADQGGPFSEENDAFVTWVSNPTLCFYEPIYTSKETNIMLLAPKADPQGCDEYLK